jgi:hypothetical protein
VQGMITFGAEYVLTMSTKPLARQLLTLTTAQPQRRCDSKPLPQMTEITPAQNEPLSTLSPEGRGSVPASWRKSGGCQNTAHEKKLGEHERNSCNDDWSFTWLHWCEMRHCAHRMEAVCSLQCPHTCERSQIQVREAHLPVLSKP